MAAINYSTMKTRVALRLGNMQSSDPFYTYLGDWVNDAANRLILRSLSKNAKRKEQMFPELQAKWRSDATSAGVEYVAYPSDCLWITQVYSFDEDTASDESRDKRYAMAEIYSQDQWELLDKSTSTTGFPRRWRRFSNRIQIHPVPTAAYLTKLLVLGFAEESDLSGSSDTFTIDSKWHPAIIDYAVYIGAKDMGWMDDAKEALEACDRQIEECITILGRENASSKDNRSWVINDPSS